jgi:hypothetical protein
MSFRIGQRVHVGVSRFSHAWLKIHHPKTYTHAPKGDAYPQLSRSREVPAFTLGQCRMDFATIYNASDRTPAATAGCFDGQMVLVVYAKGGGG